VPSPEPGGEAKDQQALPPTAPDTGTLGRCPGCGALNSPDFDRCVRCNQPLRASEPPRSTAPPARSQVPRRASLLALLAPGSGLVATKILLALTSLVFGAHLLVALSRELSLSALLLGGSPVVAVRFGALLPGNLGLLLSEPWRIWSAVFVHFGVVHFGLNMLGLLYLGRMTEPAIGAARFVLVYLSTGLLGFATTAVYFVVTGQNGLTAGASGALFGLMGLVLGLLLKRGDPRWKVWATQAVLFSVLIGFAIEVANNSAHLGGLAVGVVLGLWLERSTRRPVPRWQRVAAGVGVVGTVVCLVLAQLSPLWQMLEQARAAG
jgi:membrane associated rhomboid family serine protease